MHPKWFLRLFWAWSFAVGWQVLPTCAYGPSDHVIICSGFRKTSTCWFNRDQNTTGAYEQFSYDQCNICEVILWRILFELSNYYRVWDDIYIISVSEMIFIFSGTILNLIMKKLSNLFFTQYFVFYSNVSSYSINNLNMWQCV